MLRLEDAKRISETSDQFSNPKGCNLSAKTRKFGLLFFPEFNLHLSNKYKAIHLIVFALAAIVLISHPKRLTVLPLIVIKNCSFSFPMLCCFFFTSGLFFVLYFLSLKGAGLIAGQSHPETAAHPVLWQNTSKQPSLPPLYHWFTKKELSLTGFRPKESMRE